MKQIFLGPCFEPFGTQNLHRITAITELKNITENDSKEGGGKPRPQCLDVNTDTDVNFFLLPLGVPGDGVA